MVEELIINNEVYCGNQEDYDVIKEAINKLSSISQEQFESIKKEKWYNRLFDMLTYSQKGKKRIAEQVGTLAQAQQIFVELLLRLSNNDANISKIVLESRDDICRIQEQNIYLLSKIKRLEDIALGIKTNMDINKLSELEKKVLCACLYFINDKTGQASDEQKIYANVVIYYLGVDAQMDNPIAALEEIDIDAKKRILSCCMEYIFLKDCSDCNYSEYEEFISEFDVGGKSIASIEKQIKSLYNLRGCEGFYSKYRIENFEEIEDIFLFDFEDGIADEAEDEIEMTDENITSILQIRSGEQKIYRYKNIHLSAYINCEGELYFDHCVIYYNESDVGDEITIARNAKLSITNSRIECKGIDEHTFINCEEENEVYFDSTTFENCSYFLKATNGCNFYMMNCKVHNCFNEFILIKDYANLNTSCEILNNIIMQDGLSSFYIQNEIWNPTLFSIQSYSDKLVQFRENVVTENDDFRQFGLQEGDDANKLIYFSCRKGEVKNCTFCGISSAIEVDCVLACKFENCTKAINTANCYGTEKSLIDNCVFVGCTDVIGAGANTQITNCQFISCYNEIIFSRSYEGVEIAFCQFINTKNLIDNSYFVIPCIRFAGKKNYLRKCIFDGVELGDNFLIAADCVEKPSGTITHIEDCDFKNCSTKKYSQEIIKEYVQYDTLFKKNQSFHAIIVSGCRGLDKINKEMAEADKVEIRTISTTGNPIGSVLATSTLS